MRTLWSRWVALMDEREPPTSLALVRIAMGLVLLADLATAYHHDMITVLWGTADQGGIGLVSTWEEPPWAYAFLGDHAAGVIFAVVVLSALTFTLGLATRLSTGVLLLSYAQLAAMMPTSDRGIDAMFRAVLVLLFFSRCGQTLSIDAKWRTGRFVDSSPAMAWPRYLIVLQLAWTYFSAGIHKTQSAWWPGGDFVALWRVWNDPHFARFDLVGAGFGESPWLYLVTQLGTAGTMLFELGAPLFLLALYYRRSLDEQGAPKPGRIGRLFNRLHIREVWIVTGAVFHLGLWATVRLGIFPVGMLSLYLAFVPGDRWESWWRKHRKRRLQGRATRDAPAGELPVRS